jgi:hypothetical protein
MLLDDALEAVEFGCNVVAVAERTIDAVKVATNLTEAICDALDGFDRINNVVMTKICLTAVGVDQNGGERVDGPHQFAECADDRGQISGLNVGVMAGMIASGFDCTDRRVEKLDCSVHVSSGGSRCGHGSGLVAALTAQPGSVLGSRARWWPGPTAGGFLVDLLHLKQLKEQ